jgi:hypothetical protein
MGEHRTDTSFGLVLQGIEDDIHAAELGGCTPEGHGSICRTQRGITRAVEHTYRRVVAIPAETVALLRTEVVELVQAHATDAVKHAIGMRLPASADATATAPTPGWAEIARRFAATIAGSPWALVGIVGMLALSPSLRELVKGIVSGLMR